MQRDTDLILSLYPDAKHSIASQGMAKHGKAEQRNAMQRMARHLNAA